MKKLLFVMVTVIFVFLFVSLASAADIPMMLNYQGHVSYAYDSDAPVNDNGYFKFAIVDPNGTTTYWSNDGTSTTGNEPDNALTIPVTEGFFTIKLGNDYLTNMTALPASAFAQQNIYVRVWFSTDNINFEKLSPDTQIISSGFAYKAQTVVDNAISTTIIQDGTITNDDISSDTKIDASKINTNGLDADMLNGNNSKDFAAATHTHDGSDIVSTISATNVEHGTYFINSGGTSGQVWKSDGDGQGIGLLILITS